MTQRERWTKDELDLVRKLALERLASAPPPQPAPKPESVRSYGLAFKQAAIVSKLRPDAFANIPEPDLSQLQSVCITIREPGGTSWRALNPDVRNAVLKQLDATELDTLLAAKPQPDDVFQTALLAAKAGLTSETLRGMRPAELATLVQFHDALKKLIPQLPPRDVLERKLDLVRLLDPLKQITTSFSGRSGEVQSLRDYVGVLPAGGFFSGAARAVGAFFNLDKNRSPFLIYGFGGVGKTTLVAKFILEHALIGEQQQFPFAYLDFDRPGIMAEQPVTILMEAIRQFGLQYDAAFVAGDRLRQRWEQRLRATVSTLPVGIENQFISDFVSFLNTLGVGEGPVLLVLDTFEEVQMRSTAFALGAILLVTKIAESVPRLRVVIAGREVIPGIPFEETIHLIEFDDESAVGYLVQNGIAREKAELAVKQVGRKPLTLKLALTLLKQSPKDFGPAGFEFLSRLKDAAVQGDLFDRTLYHIKDPDIAKLAHPGLTLRRITPELIRDVLAKPCSIEVEDMNRATQLFEGLRAQLTLVREEEPGVLVHRADIRRGMLEQIRDTLPAQVAEIHRRAIDYYSQRDDVVSRAEEIYHRLSLGQSRKEIEPRMIRGLEPYLTDSREELAAPEQALLAELLGLEVSATAALAADRETWERAASRRLKEMLAVRDFTRAAAVLAERPDRSTATDLRVAEVMYLEAAGKRDDAIAKAREAIEAYDRDTNTGALFETLLIAAEIERSRGAFAVARGWLERAEEIASRRKDRVRILRVLVSRVSPSRAQGQDAGESVRAELTQYASTLTDDEWAQNLALLRDVAAETAMNDPSILERAVRLGALDFRTSDDEMIRQVLIRAGLPSSGSVRDLVHSLLVSGKTPDELLRLLVSLLRQKTDEVAQTATAAKTAPRVKLKLKGPDLARLHELLMNVKGARLATFLETRLGRGLESLSFAPDLRTLTFDVVAAANREGWIASLVIALKASHFDDPGVQRFADSIGLGVTVAATRAKTSLRPKELTELMAKSRGKAGEIEAYTCTIEMNNEVRGCGVLVGPDIVLTSRSVVMDAPSPTALAFCFDRVLFDGEVAAKGEVRALVKDWLLFDSSADEGYIFVRIDRDMASGPIDPSTADPDARPRGFAKTGHTIVSGNALIWLWRDQKGTFVSGARDPQPEPARSSALVVHSSSEFAAAGSACFDARMNYLALHCGRSPRNSKTTVVLPLLAILTALHAATKDHLLVPLETPPWPDEERDPAEPLPNPAQATLRKILLDSFTLPQIDRMLRDSLNVDRKNITIATSSAEVFARVIEYAIQQGMIVSFVEAARALRPDDDELQAFAQVFLGGIATPALDVLERILDQTRSFLDIDKWRTQLAAIERRVCRIRSESDVLGTGFLVGPSTLLTTFHTVRNLIDGTASPQGFTAQFDYKIVAGTVNEGTTVHLDKKAWLIDSSPYADEESTGNPEAQPATDQLDYALLRLDEAELAAANRGWINILEDNPSPEQDSPVFVLQHPAGEPLKLAIDMNGVIGQNANGTRIRYRVETEPGSAGSPVFDQNWRPIAMHHLSSQDKSYREGVPIHLIVDLLRKRGKLAAAGIESPQTT